MVNDKKIFRYAYDKLSSKITYNFFPTYYSSSKVLYTEGAVDRTAQNIW